MSFPEDAWLLNFFFLCDCGCFHSILSHLLSSSQCWINVSSPLMILSKKASCPLPQSTVIQRLLTDVQAYFFMQHCEFFVPILHRLYETQVHCGRFHRKKHDYFAEDLPFRQYLLISTESCHMHTQCCHQLCLWIGVQLIPHAKHFC
jgi:hypothetical protein